MSNTPDNDLAARVAKIESDLALMFRFLETFKGQIDHISANLETVFAAHNRLVEKLAGGQRPTRPLN